MPFAAEGKMSRWGRECRHGVSISAQPAVSQRDIPSRIHWRERRTRSTGFRSTRAWSIVGAKIESWNSPGCKMADHVCLWDMCYTEYVDRNIRCVPINSRFVTPRHLIRASFGIIASYLDGDPVVTYGRGNNVNSSGKNIQHVCTSSENDASASVPRGRRLKHHLEKHRANCQRARGAGLTFCRAIRLRS